MSNSTPANEYVADTMCLVLRLEGRRLGPTAKPIFEATEAGKAVVFVPALALAEILYLAEKSRIRTSLQSVMDYMQRYGAVREYPMSLAVVRAAAEITDIPELHDRLIAATARLDNLELISNDLTIQASSFVRTVW